MKDKAKGVAIITTLAIVIVTVTFGIFRHSAKDSAPAFLTGEEATALAVETFTAESGMVDIAGSCVSTDAEFTAEAEDGTSDSFVCLMFFPPTECVAIAFTLTPEKALPAVEQRFGQQLDPSECGA